MLNDGLNWGKEKYLKNEHFGERVILYNNQTAGSATNDSSMVAAWMSPRKKKKIQATLCLLYSSAKD
jgi:hypothetical protein